MELVMLKPTTGKKKTDDRQTNFRQIQFAWLYRLIVKTYLDKISTTNVSPGKLGSWKWPSTILKIVDKDDKAMQCKSILSRLPCFATFILNRSPKPASHNSFRRRRKIILKRLNNVFCRRINHPSCRIKPYRILSGEKKSQILGLRAYFVQICNALSRSPESLYNVPRA